VTLADLRRAAELLPAGASLTLPREALLAALDAQECPAVAPGDTEKPDHAEPERWLTADECREKLNVSRRWVYDHAELLGVRRLSRRCIRFDARAVSRYLNRAARRAA
jgi:hypothetical protein